MVAGSSPRVRGKLGLRVGAVDFVRLIPACAGKTPTLTVCSVSQRAHPRVCGENSIDTAHMSYKWGSSPRVRGKLCFGICRSRRMRLIPACAGKT